MTNQKQIELGNWVKEIGDEPYPIIGEVVMLISRPYIVEKVVVEVSDGDDYAQRYELNVDDVEVLH